MAAIVDTPLEPPQVAAAAAQPPPQHIQYNIDETTLRKFCQPYNMEELVTMLRSTAYVNKEFYDILIEEMKRSSKWCKLFVHGLPWTTTQETLYAAFSRFGQIQECVILKDRNGQSKGYGFINYSNAQEAINAINAGPQQIDGRMVGSDLAWKGRKNRAAHNAHKTMNKPANNAHHGYGAANRNMHAANMNTLGGPLAMRRLFVYSLLYTTTDETLHAVFSQYGELEEAVIIKDKNNEMKSKGYGFVIYKNVCDAQKALQQTDKIIDGRTVHCSLAIEGQNHNKNKNMAPNNHLLHNQTIQIAPANATLNALSAALQLQQQQQQQALQPTLQTYDPYQNVLYGNLSALQSAQTNTAVNSANPTQLLQQLLAQQIQQQQILNAQQNGEKKTLSTNR
eukprot:221700_1